MIASAGSTSERSIGPESPGTRSNSPRRVISSRDCSSMAAVYSEKMSKRFVAVACWSLKIVSGLNR